MAIERVFLDWDRPGLAAAVDYLVERFATSKALTLHDVIVVVPGGRAGRRLLEVLLEEAQQRKSVLSPPTIVTVGKLPEKLYRAQRPFADDLVQQLAWIEALKRTEAELLGRLTPAAPADNDLAGWLSLGEMLARLHRELAAENLDFRAVADCGARIARFPEAPRWQALAEIQQQYLRVLDELDLWDLQTARLYATRHGECRTDARIVLLGTADMNRTQRLMLDQVADRVTALILAPEELAGRFDGHGCVRPDAWQDAVIELADGQIEVVEDPAGEAAAVVRAIASFDGRYAAEQITVGVPDQQVVPYIQQHLRQCEVEARYGVGLPLAQSGVCRLLEAAADYLESGRFAEFAAVARHPDVEGWLAGRNIHGDWLSEADAYYCDHLPHHLGEQWLDEEGNCARLKRVHEAVEKLLAELRGEERPLAGWGQPIVDLLVSIFGQSPLNRESGPQRTILTVCEKIREILERHLGIPPPLAPTVTGADAVRLVLRQLEGETIAPLPDSGAVELLGWLELPLDDAPAVVVTGFHEGAVPSSLNADLFLPNQLRRALGIEDNDRRYARDAYALSVLAAWRQDLKLIAGRRTADGDPLAPSRLLFACDQATAARRAMAFFSPAEPGVAGSVSPGILRPGRKQSRFDVPRPRPLAEPVTSMRVTEFKDYLACPYRYYLRHRLKLEGISDSAEELDGGAFGSLAHAVLALFGEGPVAASTDAEEIRKYLDGTLDQAAARQYGDAPLSAIRVQIEQLRLRLAAFARWQAAWAAAGWRIEGVEVGPEEGRASLEVDGRPMPLRGRIDRIDVNESTAERVIFDYKTSDGGRPPERTHRKAGEWIDLQLPLYRHLAVGMGIAQPVALAYIVLPKDTGKVGRLGADWSDDELREADRKAEEVIRKVRAGEFWPPKSPPPAFAEEFAAICKDDQFGTAVAAAGQGGAD